jgi:hypothetical protein
MKRRSLSTNRRRLRYSACRHNETKASEVSEAKAAESKESASAPGSGPISVEINLNPVFHFDSDGQIDALEFRDVVMPELISVIESGVRGYRTGSGGRMT